MAHSYSEYAALIDAASKKHSVPARLIAGVIKKESNWDPVAIGDGGQARGLMQMHKGAAQDVGADWTALLNPEVAINAGTAYLAIMLKEADGNERLALAAYNQGPSIIHNQSSEAAKRGFAYADSILKKGVSMPSPQASPVAITTAAGMSAASLTPVVAHYLQVDPDVAVGIAAMALPVLHVMYQVFCSLAARLTQSPLDGTGTSGSPTSAP